MVEEFVGRREIGGCKIRAICGRRPGPPRRGNAADTESITFPKLDDRQLAMLEAVGSRRVVRCGELIFQAGKRDIPRGERTVSMIVDTFHA